MNVYDADGNAVMVAEPVEDGKITNSIRQRLYYEYGLSNPDFKIFQLPELAEQAAGASPSPEVPSEPV